MENVKGLINHDKGNTLKIILNLLKSCGYEVSFKVLNTLDFGLPQMRERVYFVGVRKDLKAKFEFNGFKGKKLGVNDIFTPLEKNKFNPRTPTFLRFLNNKYNVGRVNLTEILKDDFNVIDTRQSDLRVYKEKVPTLRRDRQGLLYTFKGEIFKLSGVEMLKLQGFNGLKNLEKLTSDLQESDILRQYGNAMSVNVVESIGKVIKDMINA